MIDSKDREIQGEGDRRMNFQLWVHSPKDGNSQAKASSLRSVLSRGWHGPEDSGQLPLLFPGALAGSWIGSRTRRSRSEVAVPAWNAGFTGGSII